MEALLQRMSSKVKVVFVEKCNAKLVQDILQSGKLLNKECRMVSTSDGLVAIPVLNIDQIDCSSEGWSDKVVRRGEYECPYSTKKLGNGRISLDSNMSRVQQSLLNWLKDDQGKIKAHILSLDVKVCPKKLEVMGDDKTLVLPPNAFSLNNTRFRTLAVAADINNLWEHLAMAHNSPRVVRRGIIDPSSPIRER